VGVGLGSAATRSTGAVAKEELGVLTSDQVNICPAYRTDQPRLRSGDKLIDTNEPPVSQLPIDETNAVRAVGGMIDVAKWS